MSQELELWRPDDAEWMKQRKQEWRHIQKVLNIFRVIKKKHYSYHKDLFFYGNIAPELTKPGLDGGKAFFSALCFFELWYHPVVSLEAYQKIFDRQQSPNNLKQSTDLLFMFQIDQYPDDYGMLGGRESLMVKTLIPSCDYNDIKTFEGRFKDKPYHLCPPSGVLYGYCVGGLDSLFLERNLNAPGQYLWEHVFKNPPFVKKRDEIYKKKLFDAIKNYETIEFYPRKSEKARKLAAWLTERLDAGAFPEKLTQLWNEVEKR